MREESELQREVDRFEQIADFLFGSVEGDEEVVLRKIDGMVIVEKPELRLIFAKVNDTKVGGAFDHEGHSLNLFSHTKRGDAGPFFIHHIFRLPPEEILPDDDDVSCSAVREDGLVALAMRRRFVEESALSDGGAETETT